MKSIVWIIGVIILIPLILGAGAMVYLNTVPVEDAILYVNKGDVFVNDNPADDGMTLSLSDTITTKVASEASLILFDSVVVDISENSKVIVEDLAKDKPRVMQESGSTWVKFLGIMGVKTFEIETPTTVATVRGTGFQVNMDSILVGEGTVEVVVDGQTFTLKMFDKVVLEDGKYVKAEMTQEEKDRIINLMKSSLITLKKIRDEKINLEYSRFKSVFDTALEKEGVTFDEAMGKIDKLDNGEMSVDEILAKSPIKSKRIDHIADLTRKIQEYQKIIDHET